MRFVMNPDMVYQYPIWAVGLLLVGAAVLGAVLLELCARRLLPIDLRQRHNDVAAAIFSIIGVTYAVLLAFVAMLAWEGFNRAKAASYAEAARIGDVYQFVSRLCGSRKVVDPERDLRVCATCCDCRMAGTGGRTHGRSGLDLPQRIEQDGARSPSIRQS